MCTMEKGKLVSCQISYLPVGSVEYLDEVNDVLDIIKGADLNYNVDAMSTTVSGDADRVFELIKDIHKEMSRKDRSYTMNIIVSNVCGCQVSES